MTRFLKTSAMFMAAACMAMVVNAEDISIKVDGMTCGGCEGKVNKALKGVEGVTAAKADSEKGSVAVSYDATKTSYDKLIASLEGTKFKALGQELKLDVEGMTCGNCEGKVKKALANVDGVTVSKVCHKSKCTEVLFDGSDEQKEKILAAIKGAGFKAE